MNTCNQFVDTFYGKRIKHTFPDYADNFIIAYELNGKIIPLELLNKKNVIIEDIESLKKDNIVIIPFNSNDIVSLDLQNQSEYQGKTIHN